MPVAVDACGASVPAVGFETLLVDALYVNWAVPRAELPPPPAPLVLESVVESGETTAFVTLVLFRQRGLHSDAAALGSSRVPAVQPAPAGARRRSRRVGLAAAPAGAGLGGAARPAGGATAGLGASLRDTPAATASRRTALGDRRRPTAGAALARRGAPASTVRLRRLGALVAFFRERPRGYADNAGGLRRIEATFDHAAGIPCRVEVERADWLEARLPERRARALAASPHSAFVVPATRLELERSRVPPSVAAALPAPTVPA
jgi:hypothetical protein